jgi:dienelactone hydrolase
MRIAYLACFSIIISILLLTSCQSKSSKAKKENVDYLFNDFKPDEFYPASQVELQINSSGSNIYGFAYTADGKGPHPTVVLLHGLPGNERNLDLAQNLRRAGINVIYFNYRGAWGSQGIYKYKNSIEDVGAVLNYITDSLNKTRLRVDHEKIAIVGHSMGAGMALIAGLNDKRVKGVFAISVFNPYTLLQGEKAEGNLIGLKEYLLSLGMLNCNPNEFLNDILKDINQYHIEKMIASSKKPIIVIDEHMNNSTFTNYNQRKNFEYKIWNSDHAFSSKRIALTKEIVAWMNKNIVSLPLEKQNKPDLKIKK